MRPIRILFNLAGGPLKASSRVRGYWIAEALKERGHEVHCTQVTVKPDYLKLAKLITRYDVVVFQKAYSRYDPCLAKWAQLLGKRVFFDIDDAPSREADPRVERAAARMMRLSDGVFAGSSALKALSLKVQPKTHLIPSGIRLNSYRPMPRAKNPGPPQLGWIGNGAHYADDLVAVLMPVLRRVAAQTPLRFRIVGACGDARLYEGFGDIPGLEMTLIDAIDWSDPDAVNAEIAQFDIGLYPLKANPFNDFKCGFKALEYMAMKVPVLASDAANHAEIIVDGASGFLLRTEEEWITALTQLIGAADLRASMGEAGRKCIEEHFDTRIIARKIEACFEKVG